METKTSLVTQFLKALAWGNLLEKINEYKADSLIKTVFGSIYLLVFFSISFFIFF